MGFEFDECMSSFGLSWLLARRRIQGAKLLDPVAITLTMETVSKQSCSTLVERLKVVKAAWILAEGEREFSRALPHWFAQNGTKEQIYERLLEGLTAFRSEGISMP